jgi:ribonuclease VapC
LIVDSSALVAIIREEPDFQSFLSALVQPGRKSISAGNWFETTLRVDNIGPEMSSRFDELMSELALEIVPFTIELAMLAREAHRSFGRGRHPAQLNFGDCIAYATAKATGEPLLFKGNDFIHTDITPALA